MTTDRVELVTGVGILLYRQNDPDQVLISREIQYKELTGKLAGQWGTTGFETQELKADGIPENHREVIERYFHEEIRVVKGNVDIPYDLEEAKLCIARISPPEKAAWVHVYHTPVSDDFKSEIGECSDEISEVQWASCKKILAFRGTRFEKIIRPPGYEILQEHVWFIDGMFRHEERIYPNPLNLPPWEVYQLIEQGFSQDQALSLLGYAYAPRILRESSDLIRLLSPQRYSY